MTLPQTFEADVYIRHVPTGEVRVYRSEETVDDELGWSPYIWDDGNFSCDCNRFLFFERAAGVQPNLLSAKCGDGEYAIDKIVRVDNGKTIYVPDA